MRREFAQVPGDDEPRYQGWAAAQGVAMGLTLPAPRSRRPPAAVADGPLAATSALLVTIDRAVDVVLQFASEPGDESLAVAVAPERVAALAAHIEAEAERRGVALDADISLVECRDADELAALLRRADRTIDSGCPLLERAGSRIRACARCRPTASRSNFLMVNTYPSNPARHGGGIRIQNLWGSMPADICAQAVVLAHTDGGPALMPLTRARPGFEQHVPFWPELRAGIAQLNAVTGTSSDDIALALAATGDDPFTQALRSAVGSRRRRAGAGPSVHGASGDRRRPGHPDHLRLPERGGRPQGLDVPRRRGRPQGCWSSSPSSRPKRARTPASSSAAPKRTGGA